MDETYEENKMRSSKLINTKHWRGTPKAPSTDKDVVTPDLSSSGFKYLQHRAKRGKSKVGNNDSV